MTATRIVAVVMLSCVAAAAQESGDRASVEAFYRSWMGAAVKQGAAAYASYFAADGQLLPPGEPPVTGRDAIAGWFTRSQRDAPYIVKPEGIQVDEMRFLAGAWVIHRSTLRGQRMPKAGGDPSRFETKYFDVLRRGDDGNWQVAYRMWNDNIKP